MEGKARLDKIRQDKPGNINTRQDKQKPNKHKQDTTRKQ